MGYMKHKYTRTYFLKEDCAGNKTVIGVEGVEDFKRGGIREHDLDILRRMDFRGKNVLDLGFGRGEAIKYALDNGAHRVVGVDFSEDANAIVRAFLTHYGLQAELHCMDALIFFQEYATRKDAESFDIVLMLDFIEHVPRSELTNVLTVMHDWLSDRAVLAINTPVFQVDNDVIADGLDPRARDTSDDYEETAGMHCNRYTKASLRNYLRSCGFTAISGHFFVPNLSIARVLDGTPWAWWIAGKRSYPVLRFAMWQKEYFEYAISLDEIKRKQNSKREQLLRAIQRPFALLSVVLRTDKRISMAGVSRRLIGYCRCNGGVPLEKKSDPQWLRVTGGPLQGYYLFLDLKAAAFWHKEMMEGCYDAFIYDALVKLVRIEGATVWDVGAHIGYHSLAFAALVGPSGHVVAFEPNPHNMERLRQHLGRNDDLQERITLMTCALGNVDGEEDFVFSPEVDDGRSSGSHLNQAFVPEEPGAYQSFIQTRVPVVTADTLLRDKSVPAPSIIKIDVEGAEALVLAGAQHLLRSLRPVLLIEVHHITAMHDTLNILLRLGYHTSILNDAPKSSSRCFIVAQPEDSQPLNGVTAANEDAQ